MAVFLQAHSRKERKTRRQDQFRKQNRLERKLERNQGQVGEIPAKPSRFQGGRAKAGTNQTIRIQAGTKQTIQPEKKRND